VSVFTCLLLLIFAGLGRFFFFFKFIFFIREILVIVKEWFCICMEIELSFNNKMVWNKIKT